MLLSFLFARLTSLFVFVAHEKGYGKVFFVIVRICTKTAEYLALVIMDGKTYALRYYQREVSDNSTISPSEKPAAVR